MAEVGFDALVLDMQHGMGIGPDRAADWIQLVARCGVTPFVRVPWNEPAFVQWVLDAGALGIIVPLIGSYADAAKAGGACRYSRWGTGVWGRIACATTVAPTTSSMPTRK